VDASLLFLARRPPRTGWIIFWLALGSVLILPWMLAYSALDLTAGPALLGVVAGLIFGLTGWRGIRLVLVIPALLLPFGLMDLLPPLYVVAADLRSLMHLVGHRPKFLLPSTVRAAASLTATTLRAAWDGDTEGLTWSVTHLTALFGYLAAGILGTGLRRGARPLAWSLPLLVMIAATGITAQAGSFFILLGVFLTLLVSLVGGFASRERDWERQGTSFSDVLRWDVAGFGSALLAGGMLLGLLVPAVPRNFVTTWLWTDVNLPRGLARLDKPDANLGRGDYLVQGGTQPGENLELGLSLEEGDRTQVTLTVRAPGVPPSSLPYWRGRIFDTYTGRGWTTGPVRAVPAEPLPLGPPPSDLIAQQIVDRRDGPKLRYGIPDIVAANIASTVEEGAVASVAWTGSDKTYTVYSRPPAPLPITGAEAVQTARTLAAYQSVPKGIPQRVVDLAQQLTQDAPTQIARAAALETYLRNLRYSYEVAPLQPGDDAVDQFLFTMRSGYCTYYASAMAIMARIVGIPSRVAVGYATGTYDRATGTYVVHESDAHAWPELYIEGQGWTRWEPTPIRPVPAHALQNDVVRTPATPATTSAPVRFSPWWGLALLGIGILVLLASGQLRRLSRPLSPAGVHRDLYRIGRRAGVQPTAGDSVEEYAGRLARTLPPARQPIERVAQLLTARLYRKAPLTANEERTLISSWYTVRSLFQRRPNRL
jgi:transglutaminase-like putative cysteine protease